jgi:hypothetical protein
LYQGGSLEGRRHIENSEGIPFVASWNWPVVVYNLKDRPT